MTRASVRNRMGHWWPPCLVAACLWPIGAGAQVGPAPESRVAEVPSDATATAPPRLTPPRWLNSTTPVWPEGAEGGDPVDVVAVVTVDPSGAPTEVSLEGNAASPVFWEAARTFVLAQHFEPARRDGQAIAARVGLRLRFEPPAPPPPAPLATPPTPVSDMPVAAPESTPDGAQGTYGATASIENGTDDARVVAASDMRIEVGTLHEVPRRDAMQLLTLSPGIVLTNHSGEGHAYGAYLRGFDAGEGQDMEVRVAGIPINEPSNAHLHGYADTHFLIPELVHSVRVLQGPFDARQGDFAAAGTAEFELRAAEPGVRVQFGLGSYGRRRLLALWSPSAASRDTFVAVDLSDGDGYGPNRAHGSVRALGQFAGRTKHLEYRVLLASHALRFDSAGVVRQDAVDDGDVDCGSSDLDDFYCLLARNQGGHASRHLASFELRDQRPGAEWSQQFTLMFRNSRFRENFTGELLDPRGDAVDQQTAAVTLVGGGHYRFAQTWGEQTQTFEVGYEGRYDVGDSQIWRVRRKLQVPYAVMFDNELALTRVSLYALAELTFAPWLGLTLGGRADTFGYDILDRNQPDSDREGERLPLQATNAWGTNFQPRATLSVGPFAGLTWISSFGIGSRSSDAAALSEGERAPFTRIWAGESGLMSLQEWGDVSTEVRAAFFYAYVDHDMLFDQIRTRNVPIGATNRFGAYAHARLGYGQHLDTSSSFTWADAYESSDGHSAGFVTGPRLPFIPRFVVRGDAAVSESLQTRDEPVHLRAGVGLSWVGPRPLPLNTVGHPQLSLDVSARARFRMFEIGVSGTNLTNYENRSSEYFYASNFGTGGPVLRRVHHFSAAPPREFLATFAVIFDPAPAAEE